MLTYHIAVIILQYVHIKIIMLYALNEYNVICRLYLSKTGGGGNLVVPGLIDLVSQ